MAEFLFTEDKNSVDSSLNRTPRKKLKLLFLDIDC